MVVEPKFEWSKVVKRIEWNNQRVYLSDRKLSIFFLPLQAQIYCRINEDLDKSKAVAIKRIGILNLF